MTVRNPARERLRKGELSLGIGLRQARTVDIAAAMASCGFDWLFIDLEHGTMPLGIVMPHVDSAEEARSIVGHLKYPPLGHRSMAGAMALFGFRAVPTGEAAK